MPHLRGAVAQQRRALAVALLLRELERQLAADAPQGPIRPAREQQLGASVLPAARSSSTRGLDGCCYGWMRGRTEDRGRDEAHLAAA